MKSNTRDGRGHTRFDLRAKVERLKTVFPADWAVRFYQKHGFRLVSSEEKDRLLPFYWGVPQRQIETSVVLGDERWLARKERGSEGRR